MTFKRELSDDHEANMNAIPRWKRAMVRKGIRPDWSAKSTTTSSTCTGHIQSVRNLGTPVFPKAHFRAIRVEFGEDVDVVTVRHEGMWSHR